MLNDPTLRSRGEFMLAGRELVRQEVVRVWDIDRKGAAWVYISATPAENTIDFYLRRGCVLAEELDSELFELEPKDIHLECAV
jgi:hypothetical protein